MVTPSASPESHLSATEIVERIRQLSDADLLRLKKASQYWSFGARPRADLLNESLQRALAGGRKCPRNLDLVTFLIGVMRSIASSDRRASKRGIRLVLVPKDASSGGVFEGKDPRLSPEDHLINEQEALALKMKILELFGDDLVAQTLVEGMIDGMEGEELRTFVELSEKDYASKRRLIRRRIDKAFPEGLTP